MSTIILESDRDRRTYAWLVAQVGAEAVEAAAANLAGGRRPYVSNIAKALGLVVPAAVAAEPAPKPTDRETARQRVAALRRALAPRESVDMEMGVNGCRNGG